MSDKYKSYSITLQMADGSRHKIPIAVPVGEKGDPGDRGIGIASIAKTATSGLTDTYTITFSDGRTTTFAVTHGKDGTNGKDGDPFLISKTFPSVAEMNAGATTDGVLVGQYVAIDTNVEDPDSAKIFIKTENGYKFVVNLSGKEGIQGPKGKDGNTPVLGEDYFTPEDKAEIVERVIDELPPSGVSDVQLNGETIVDENGVATIPVITVAKGGVGITRVGNLANGQIGVRNINGSIALAYPEASINGFKQRKTQGSQYSGTVSSNNFDLAVKTAMTDGIGAEWTEVERAAARARMGAVSLEEVLAVIKPMLGTYFPTGEAGFYRHGTNFTELLCTWDEYIANGVDIDGQHYEGGINNVSGGSGWLMFTVPADVIIQEGHRYDLMGVECGNVVLPADVNYINLAEWGVYKDMGFEYPDVHGDIKSTTLYIKAKTPPTNPYLSDCPNLSKIVVLKGCADAYKSATGWCDYAEIIVEGIIE